VGRIITAAVQRARNLDSMNQGLAEQLQRACSDIAQVPRPSTHTRTSRAFSPITQLVHEQIDHAHGRRAADDKVRRHLLPASCLQRRVTKSLQIVDLELLLSRTSSALGRAGGEPRAANERLQWHP
jgi:hypothetical protein